MSIGAPYERDNSSASTLKLITCMRARNTRAKKIPTSINHKVINMSDFDFSISLHPPPPPPTYPRNVIADFY